MSRAKFLIGVWGIPNWCGGGVCRRSRTRLVAAALFQAYGQFPQRKVWLADSFQGIPPPRAALGRAHLFLRMRSHHCMAQTKQAAEPTCPHRRGGWTGASTAAAGVPGLVPATPARRHPWCSPHGWHPHGGLMHVVVLSSVFVSVVKACDSRGGDLHSIVVTEACCFVFFTVIL